MNKLIFILLIISFSTEAQINKYLKFSTFYIAANGGTSISDVDVYSIQDGLQTSTIQTPYDYNLSLGVRKIARFGYENRAQTFYDGTETSWSDAATLGKVSGLEFLFEFNKKRQEGDDYLDQHYFIRYVDNDWLTKVEYLQDGFADIQYYEASQRYRYKYNKHLSFNIGAVQRIAEPYGYDPLSEWLLDNGDIHYTYLAIQEGYTIDVHNSEYKDPNGNIVATSSDVWKEIIIPGVLRDYVERKRDELPAQWNHSLVVGYDYYYYTKMFWLHSWANLLPWHYDAGNEYSYHKYNNGQWLDYSGGVIFGYKYSKQLGLFAEGKYNKYWNREWYDFKLGVNYILL